MNQPINERLDNKTFTLVPLRFMAKKTNVMMIQIFIIHFVICLLKNGYKRALIIDGVSRTARL